MLELAVRQAGSEAAHRAAERALRIAGDNGGTSNVKVRHQPCSIESACPGPYRCVSKAIPGPRRFLLPTLHVGWLSLPRLLTRFVLLVSRSYKRSI